MNDSHLKSPYERVRVPISEIIARVNIGDPQCAPNLILGVGPARSGSTVMMRVFGASGIEAHFQQLKNILRWLMQGEEFSFNLPQTPSQTCFLKETIGPYSIQEAAFNPLTILLEAGYPPEKLLFCLIGRHPLSTWASWKHWFGHNTSLELFKTATQTVETMRRQAIHQGMLTTTLAYEILKEQQPETVINRLFTRLGIPFSPIACQGWEDLPAFGDPGSNIVLPEEPEIFVVPHVHDRASNTPALIFYPSEKAIWELPEEECSWIESSGAFSIYDDWLASCRRDLGFETPP